MRNFNQYLSSINEDFTSDMASNYYMDDDQLLQKLKSNPNLHQKFSKIAQNLSNMEQENTSALQAAQQEVAQRQAALVKVKKMRENFRFKMSQAAAEMEGGVPQMTAGATQMRPTDPSRLRKIPSR